MSEVSMPRGYVKQCRACTAPMVEPWPEGWTLEMDVSKGGGDWTYMAHRPDCPTSVRAGFPGHVYIGEDGRERMSLVVGSITAASIELGMGF